MEWVKLSQGYNVESVVHHNTFNSCAVIYYSNDKDDLWNQTEKFKFQLYLTYCVTLQMVLNVFVPFCPQF